MKRESVTLVCPKCEKPFRVLEDEAINNMECFFCGYGSEEAIQLEEDHPIEDIYGLEIGSEDCYWIFGNDVVSDTNLKNYLIEKQNAQCYKAI